MTWNDLVRKYFPDADDRFCEWILWERTNFPFAPAEYIEDELKDEAVSMLAWRKNNLDYTWRKIN